jgi:hypothetical protein
MFYQYTIKNVPSDTNPNEQAPGFTIVDDRLYGVDVVKIYGGNAVYLSNDFSKDTYSNTVNLPYQTYDGNIIALDTIKPCTCE